ncbi:MAG TPA: hypothetical protein VGS27_02610 [Candidatus Sulfotelmatobacter sp.]|nr:hypothetical protein [Candidatus Sulfotelmatobacter sp.]
MYVAVAGKSLDPALGKPFHKLLANGGTLPAGNRKVVHLDYCSPILAIKKANRTVGREPAILAVPYIRD